VIILIFFSGIYPPSEQVNVTLKRDPKAKSGTTVTQPHLFHKKGKQPAEN